jgi:hypothetical protein
VSDFPRKLLSLTAEQGQHPTDPIATVYGEALVKSENKGTSKKVKGIEQQIEGQEDVVIPRRVGDRDEDVEFASKYDDVSRSFYSDELNTLAKDKDGHSVDNCSATEHHRNEKCRKIMKVAADERTLCFTMTSSDTDALDKQHTTRGLNTRQMTTDHRLITAEQLRGKVSEKKLVTTTAGGVV